MTNKAAFTPEELTKVIEGPTSAGFVVVTASRGGMFRETFAMSKAYAEARTAHGQSELLDEIVGSKPKMEHAHGLGLRLKAIEIERRGENRTVTEEEQMFRGREDGPDTGLDHDVPAVRR